MFEDVNHDRRRFLGTAITSMATASFGVTFPAGTQANETKLTPISPAKLRPKPRSNASFGPLKQIDAGLPALDTRRPAPAPVPP